MCGFAGSLGEPTVDEAALLEALRLRGPECSHVRRPSFVAWQSRLAIVAREAGSLPIVDGRWVLLGAGQIHNYRELAAGWAPPELVARGDLAVALGCIQREGLAALRRFRGPFALAVWDGACLLLARDRLGRRPLFLQAVGAGTAFATSLRALSAMGADPTPSAARIQEFLSTGTTAADGALAAACRAVRPGTALEIGPSGERVHDWAGAWTPSAEPLDGCLRRALDRAWVADVPPAVALSGGVDSTLLAWAGARRGPVDTYTLVALGGRDPTRARARRAAALLGTRHHEIEWAPPGPEEALEVLRRRLDRAAAGPEVLHNDALHAAVRARTLNGGHGADEVLGGYGRYVAIAAGRTPSWPRARHAARWGALGRGRLLEAARSEAPSDRPHLRAQWADLRVLQAWDNLHLPDENGLAHGVEVRAPFLDEDLVAAGFAAAYPSKEVVSATLAGTVPRELLEAPKLGFDTPFRYPEWIATHRAALWSHAVAAGARDWLPPAVRAALETGEAWRTWPLLGWRAAALGVHAQTQRWPQIRGQ